MMEISQETQARIDLAIERGEIEQGEWLPMYTMRNDLLVLRQRFGPANYGPEIEILL